MKVCSKCGKEKSITEFYKKGERLQAECKECFKERRLQAYYEKQEKVNEIKCDSGCVVCGYSEHSVCLDLHHRDGEDKENNVSRLVTQNASWKKIQSEIDKCIVLCAICHRKLHSGLISL